MVNKISDVGGSIRNAKQRETTEKLKTVASADQAKVLPVGSSAAPHKVNTKKSKTQSQIEKLFESTDSTTNNKQKNNHGLVAAIVTAPGIHFTRTKSVGMSRIINQLLETNKRNRRRKMLFLLKLDVKMDRTKELNIKTIS